jgi:beta-glucosidase
MVSDWSSFSEMINHGYAENKIDAAEKAILSGSQMDMESGVFINHLTQLVKSKKVPASLIDKAVRDILYYKFKLGLFDDPFRYHNEQREKANTMNDETMELSELAACKSMVLLKNDNATLPIGKEVRNILVVGNLADNHEAALDFWSAKGDPKVVTTYLEGIKNKFSSAAVTYRDGYNENNVYDVKGEAELMSVAGETDVVIAIIGISGKLAGEARSLSDISPSNGQMELLRKLHESGKKVVVLVHAARPMILTDVLPLCSSLLYCWIGGTKMGSAAAEIVSGDFNPTAKLTMSFPYAMGQIPVYYNAYNTGRPHVDGRNGPDDFWVSRYRDIPNAPLFPFGYGLSYSSYEYSNLQLSSSVMDKKGSITCTLSVKNTGKIDGSEIVQLYIRDVAASYVRPIKELKAFKKIELKAGESKVVSFSLTPAMLSYYDPEGKTLLESGNFKVFVGKNSADLLESQFTLK